MFATLSCGLLQKQKKILGPYMLTTLKYRTRNIINRGYYFTDGARSSIDSSAMADYRPSDIQLNFLNNASNLASVTSVSEVVIVPSNLQSSGGSSQVGASDNGGGPGSVAAPSEGVPSGSGVRFLHKNKLNQRAF